MVTKKGVCRHVKSTRMRCYVDWNGDVVPCCNHPSAHNFGSLKYKKFTDIYDGFTRHQFIKILDKNRNLIKPCGKCDVK